jgi:hypothetical protein
MQGSSARRIAGAVSAAYRSISVLALIGVLGALAGCWDSSTNDNAAPSTPQLTSISVSPPDSSVAAGLAQTLTATGIYSDGSKQDISSSVTWTSSGTAIATINTGGKATALSTGSTTITAMDGAIAVSKPPVCTPITRFMTSLTRYHGSPPLQRLPPSAVRDRPLRQVSVQPSLRPHSAELHLRA